MAAGDLIRSGSAIGVASVIREFDSNVTGAVNDLVNIQSGQIEIADAGERIAGVLLEAVTSSSSAAQVEVTPFLTVVMGNDNTGTTFAATHVGSAFDITGGTGAQIVDTSTVVGLEVTTQSAQLLCLGYNPQGFGVDSDTSFGRFQILEKQF